MTDRRVVTILIGIVDISGIIVWSEQLTINLVIRLSAEAPSSPCALSVESSALIRNPAYLYSPTALRLR